MTTTIILAIISFFFASTSFRQVNSTKSNDEFTASEYYTIEVVDKLLFKDITEIVYDSWLTNFNDKNNQYIELTSEVKSFITDNPSNFFIGQTYSQYHIFVAVTKDTDNNRYSYVPINAKTMSDSRYKSINTVYESSEIYTFVKGEHNSFTGGSHYPNLFTNLDECEFANDQLFRIVQIESSVTPMFVPNFGDLYTEVKIGYDYSANQYSLQPHIKYEPNFITKSNFYEDEDGKLT